MARCRSFALLTIICVLLGLSSPHSHAGLASSPWPMFRHDPSHSGASPAHDPTPAGAYWKYSVGGGYSSCVIGPDNTIYVGGSTYLYALNPGGTLKWRCAIGGTTRSTPAIADDGTIYIGSTDYKLYAVSPAGTVIWTFPTGNQISSSPAIAPDGTIYVGSMDNKLYAVNPDGTQKWAFTTGGQVHVSSPAVGSDGTVYVGSYDGNLYAINPDGTEKWRCTTEEEVLTTPALSPDGTTVYFACWDNDLYAVSTADGVVRWRFAVGLIHGNTPSSPAVGPDGTIYIGSLTGRLHAISPSGTELWYFETGFENRDAPAISADGTVYIGCYNGLLYAVNHDGTEKWHFMARNAFYESPTIAADGTVVIGSTDGYLYGNLRSTPAAAVPPDSLTASVLSPSQVRLTWQDRSSDEYGFRIERRLVPDGAYAQVATTAAGVTTYTDNLSGSGLTFSYRVCAYQQGGYSAYTNEATVTMPGIGMPTDLVATAVSGTRVNLTWRDRATNETGFRIERMVGPFGFYRQIGVVGQNATSFSDTSANPAITYYYRVCAFNSEGRSDYSNEAWALTDGMDFTEIARDLTCRRQMALTFDCGITPIRPGILDILKAKGVYATFFVTGVVANQVPDSVRRIVLEGHQIANHTYSHPNLTTVTDEEVVRQLQLADDIIYGICGHHTRPFFRAPAGYRDARVLAAAQTVGFRSVYWIAGGGDFGGWTVQQIIDNTLLNAKEGGVMLYHASVQNTELALPTIIDELRARGYDLVTVAEMVAPEVVTSTPYDVGPGWNLISIPCEIANTMPQVVFRGINIDGRLYRWDKETASQDLYDAYAPDNFGPISPDEGYWLYLDGPATVRVAGCQPSVARHIKLPQTNAGNDHGYSLVGYPFDTVGDWQNCTVRNPALGPAGNLSLYEAVEAGWVPNGFFWWNSAEQSQYDAGAPEYWPSTTQILPWHGYMVTSWPTGLEMIFPKP